MINDVSLDPISPAVSKSRPGRPLPRRRHFPRNSLRYRCHPRDLRLILPHDFHEAFRTVLVDMLCILAVVEILRHALAYFSEGRVKVTYIIDTVILTVLTEAMSFCYRDFDWQRLAMSIALVVSLACIRIAAAPGAAGTVTKISGSCHNIATQWNYADGTQ